jgi:hypothetical protein
MNTSKEYFLCDTCKNKNFIKLRNFSVQFRNVNFSNELIYDEVIEEIYQCTHCKKTFTKKQIESGLKALINEKKKTLSPS